MTIGFFSFLFIFVIVGSVKIFLVFEPDFNITFQGLIVYIVNGKQKLRKQLQDKGYKAYVRQAQTGQGEVSRVFIGPKLDKALALAVKEEVDPAFKVNSLVLRFKP